MKSMGEGGEGASCRPASMSMHPSADVWVACTALRSPGNAVACMHRPMHPRLPQPTCEELSACCRPAVWMLSSRMDARSASSFPSSWLRHSGVRVWQAEGQGAG